MRNLIIMLIILVAGFCEPGVSAQDRKGVIFRYVPPASHEPQIVAMYKDLVNRKMLESEVDLIGSKLRLPRDILVTIKECRAEAASYDREKKEIVLCYEFYDSLNMVFLSQHTRQNHTEPTDQEMGRLLMRGYDVMTFTLYHEIAHALIDQLKLPAVGREEDAADQLATIVLLRRKDGPEIAGSVAIYFSLLAEQQAAGAGFVQTRVPYWDEHSFDLQRMYNIICHVYGSDPARFSDLAGSSTLPASRAAKCQPEFESIGSAWRSLLAPHSPAPSIRDKTQ